MNIIIIMTNFPPSLLNTKGFFVAYWLAPQPCIEGLPVYIPVGAPGFQTTTSPLVTRFISRPNL